MGEAAEAGGANLRREVKEEGRVVGFRRWLGAAAKTGIVGLDPETQGIREGGADERRRKGSDRFLGK